MILFIDFLRALAACLITNSHYTGVYPIDALANGGITGNVIFCAVSGYCLYRIRDSFPKWYAKRLHRLYLPTWLITVAYLLLGAYTLSEHNLLWWLIYPTGYHFIASIVLLYAVFYLLLRPEVLRQRIPQLMGCIALVFTIYYLFFFDKSEFHILDVRKLPVRLLLLESMLLGAWMRQRDEQYRNRPHWWHLPAVIVLSGMDLVARYLLTKHTALAPLQFISPLIFFAQLYCIFRLFASLDAKLEKMPEPIIRIIRFLSTLTLEIYVVQGPLIEWLRPLLGFPLNWFALTASILAAAIALHLISTTMPKHLRKKRCTS